MKSIQRWTVALWLVLGVCAIWYGNTQTALAQDAKSPQAALIIYGDAANFQNNGAFELAADEWDKFLKRFPDDPLAPKAQHYLGVCNLQLKRFQKAADAFDVVIKKHPTLDAIQDAYLNLGWCQYSLAGQKIEGMYAKAAATFSEMAEKFPKGKYADQALFFLGESEYNQDKRKQAAVAYHELVTKHPQSSLRCDALYALGVTYEELERYADASQTYDLFLKDYAENELVTEVRMRKAETVLQADDFAAAEKLFGEVAAVEGFASADHAVFRRAYCLSKLGKSAEAGAMYARIPTDHKESVYVAEASMSAGRCYYRAGQLADAEKWLTNAVAAGGKFAPEAAHWLCRIHLKQNEPQKAVALAQQVLPKAAESQYQVNLKMDQADALYETSDSRAQALDLYLQIATEHAQHELAPQAMYNAAFAALELGTHDDGLKHAATFLEAYPEDRLLPDVKYVAAECQLQKKQYEGAEKAYAELTDAYQQHPEIEVWRVRFALAIYLQKKYPLVIETLSPVVSDIKGADNLAEAQFLIGASQFFMNKFAPAAKALQASVKANPRWRQADETLIFLARALREQTSLDEATKTIAKMITDFPKSSHLDHAHYRHGEFSYAADDYATAIAQYDAVIAGWPKSEFAAYAKYGKGWAQLKSKAYADANQTLTALIADHAEHKLLPDAYFARGMSRRQTGEQDGAIEDVNAYLASEPDLANQCDALYERGLAEVAAKKNADAAATFAQLLKANPKYTNADKVLYELAWAQKSSDDDSKQADAVTNFATLASDHPDSPLAAEASFHVGESHYEKGEYDEAAKAYAAAIAKNSAKDLGEKAVYKLGWSLFKLKQYDEALADFNEQLAGFPEGPLKADALFMKAECLYRLENYEEALPAYKATQGVKLSSPAISVLAVLHGGQSASQLKQWDDALAMLAQIPEEHAESSYVAEAYYELGWAKQNSGKEDDAIKDYEQAATLSRGAVGARARFMIGELYFARKKYAEAILEFQQAMYRYGGDNAPADVKKWQAKSGYEAGRCADVRIKDAVPADRAALIAEAKKYYQYVVEKHPQDELAAQSQKRLTELAKL